MQDKSVGMKHFIISLTILSLASVMSFGQAQETKAITGATLIDGTGHLPIKDAVIVIEGAYIQRVGTGTRTRVPEGARIIDARGKFIIPGLADMHNHLGDGAFSPGQAPQDYKKNLSSLLAWGVTTVFAPGFEIDMKTFAELKRVSAENTAPYPHFFGLVRVFTAKGGYGWERGYTPETPEEARAAVRELKAANVDGVKLAYTDLTYATKRGRPMLKPEVMATIIDEAHRHELKAYVHAPILKYAKEALHAGADGLVHGIISDPIDDEFITLMKKNQAVYITTHAVFEAGSDMAAWARRADAFDERGMIAKEVYEDGMSSATVSRWEAKWDTLGYVKGQLPILRANLKKASDAGVLVVMGSDSSSGSDPSSGGGGLLLGLASQMELMLLVEAGLKPEEAIRAATINVARVLGRERELGTVEPGKLADLLILEANPVADIRTVHQIYRVVKGGVVYDPGELLRSAK